MCLGGSVYSGSYGWFVLGCCYIQRLCLRSLLYKMRPLLGLFRSCWVSFRLSSVFLFYCGVMENVVFGKVSACSILSSRYVLINCVVYSFRVR